MGSSHSILYHAPLNLANFSIIKKKIPVAVHTNDLDTQHSLSLTKSTSYTAHTKLKTEWLVFNTY